MRSSKQRSRNKPNRNVRPSGGNVINRVFDSSGPEGKVRGTPAQIIEKYTQLHRDAQLSGDRVNAENFSQHAEHYTRILAEATREVDRAREEQEQFARERQTERDRQMESQRDRDRDRAARLRGQEEAAGAVAEGASQGDRQGAPQADRQQDRQPDRQPDRQADRQHDRQAERQHDVQPRPQSDRHRPQPRHDDLTEPSFLSQPLFPTRAAGADGDVDAGLVETPEGRQGASDRGAEPAFGRTDRPRRDDRWPRRDERRAEAAPQPERVATAQPAPEQAMPEPAVVHAALPVDDASAADKPRRTRKPRAPRVDAVLPATDAAE